MSILMIVLTILAAWLVVSVLLALAIGRAVRLAARDQQRRMASKRPVAVPARPRARVTV